MIGTIRCLGASREETESDLRSHAIRVAPEEIAGLAEKLGRDPTVAEAFLIDVAHSEHCSYKSSRRFLRAYLPELAPHVVLGPGEDAGVVDIGEWEGARRYLVVAHESHNHPSQLLPVEGAATGIGGIVRDVYCMGADVIGVLDGLRFGDLDGPDGVTARAVARGVVRGIWEYGNALGVPNLGGDLAFGSGYDDNCLVNVVAVGIVKADRLLRSRVPEQAGAEPYLLLLVGKPTDRSGLGGASFASQILDGRAAEANLGAVQIHDPFLKRVLVEATKAVWDLLDRTGVRAGFKDLGAGGFGGASSELVAAGGFGAEIELDRLPAADPSILPEHLLVGETQERFVWALPERIVADVLALYNESYDLPGIYPGARAAVVGRVVPGGSYRVAWKGRTIVDLPNSLLAEPPELRRPVRARPVRSEEGRIEEPADWREFVLRMVAHPALCSRAHVYRHYDAEVRGEALLRPGEADAGVCRPFPGATLGIAVSLDGNGRWCALDPYHGAAATVLETVRNVVAVGARPRALTDCLNFGSPEDPECLWEFERSLAGMRDACVALGLPEGGSHPMPIVSGNVSFYNQSAGGRRIDPTPILACFGVLSDWRRALRPQARQAGSRLLLVSSLRRSWGASPALDILRGSGAPPRPDPAGEARAIWGVLDAIESGDVLAAHDVGEGGLLAAAVEMMLREEGPTGLGLEIDCAATGLPAIEALSTEEGGFLLEVSPDREGRLLEALDGPGVRAVRIGTVREGGILLLREGTATLCALDAEEIWRPWARRLGEWIEGGRS